MRVTYIRVSTVEQNIDRQEKTSVKSYTDKVSGSIAFAKRPSAKRLLRDIEGGLISEIEVHSLDRLGRNTKNIIETIELFNSKKINLIIKKEGIRTLNDDKTPNTMGNLLIGILSSVAEFELTKIRERTAEGISIRKEKGLYEGRKKGTTEDVSDFLKKHKKCLSKLRKGLSIAESAKFSGISYNTAKKVSILMT